MIETKTLRYTRAQLVLAGDAARWLARRRRRYPSGVRPVICLARGRRVERFEDEVLLVSLDRLCRSCIGRPDSFAAALAAATAQPRRRFRSRTRREPGPGTERRRRRREPSESAFRPPGRCLTIGSHAQQGVDRGLTPADPAGSCRHADEDRDWNPSSADAQRPPRAEVVLIPAPQGPKPRPECRNHAKGAARLRRTYRFARGALRAWASGAGLSGGEAAPSWPRNMGSSITASTTGTRLASSTSRSGLLGRLGAVGCG